MIGEVAAGYVYDGEVRPGTAVRIMTGAPIPQAPTPSSRSRRRTNHSVKHRHRHDR